MDDYEHLRAMLAERDTALIALDLEWARKRDPRLTEHALLIGMHKARYECINIPADLREQSRAWLEQYGYLRFEGLPWPDRGVLPE